MTIPTSTVKTTVQSWLVSVSGLSDSNVIFAYQNAPEPTGQFITIIPTLMIRKYGLLDEHRWNADGTINTYRVRGIVTQIDCYGSGAVDTLSAVHDAIDSPSTYQTFSAVKLGLRADSDVRYLPEQKGQRWEDRASLDLRILCTTTEDAAADLGWFETIKYDGGAGDSFVDRITEQTIT